MKHGIAIAAVATALLASGCAHEAAPTPPPPVTTSAADPSLDLTQPPARAVLALVPQDVTTVTVTDFDQVRVDLGLPDVGDASPAADRAAFWQRAESERPLLSRGMLRADDAELAGRYGFSSLDVSWEAHLLDRSGAESGWVLAFRDGTDMAKVQQAVQDGAGPLAGATVDAADRLVTRNVTDDPMQSWAADADTADLATGTADSAYLSKACADQTAGADPASGLESLPAWSVQFEDTLVTARLGADRADLFDRMRLTGSDPGFSAGFSGGVADPQTGRIGFVMADPVAAARLALRRDLPFAACA